MPHEGLRGQPRGCKCKECRAQHIRHQRAYLARQREKAAAKDVELAALRGFQARVSELVRLFHSEANDNHDPLWVFQCVEVDAEATQRLLGLYRADPTRTDVFGFLLADPEAAAA